jgi:hypothetical protein
MDNGSGAKDYRTCMQKKNIKLPTGYYFGVSVSIIDIFEHKNTQID